MTGRPNEPRQLRCPTCKARFTPPERERQHLPFCGERCKMADLGRWLGGEYALPSDEPVDEGAYLEALLEQERQDS